MEPIKYLELKRKYRGTFEVASAVGIWIGDNIAINGQSFVVTDHKLEGNDEVIIMEKPKR